MFAGNFFPLALFSVQNKDINCQFLSQVQFTDIICLLSIQIEHVFSSSLLCYNWFGLRIYFYKYFVKVFVQKYFLQKARLKYFVFNIFILTYSLEF